MMEMKENKKMVLEQNIIQMEIYFKGILKKMLKKDLEYYIILMEINIKEYG